MIDQQRMQLDSLDISILADFAEKHFTTGRFAECEQRLTSLIAQTDTSASTNSALRAIQIANLLALSKSAVVATKLDELTAKIVQQSEEFTVGWSFEGTKNFISQREELKPYRERLMQFIESIEQKGRDPILHSLRKLHKNFVEMLSTRE